MSPLLVASLLSTNTPYPRRIDDASISPVKYAFPTKRVSSTARTALIV